LEHTAEVKNQKLKGLAAAQGHHEISLIYRDGTSVIICEISGESVVRLNSSKTGPTIDPTTFPAIDREIPRGLLSQWFKVEPG